MCTLRLTLTLRTLRRRFLEKRFGGLDTRHSYSSFPPHCFLSTASILFLPILFYMNHFLSHVLPLSILSIPFHSLVSSECVLRAVPAEGPPTQRLGQSHCLEYHQR